MEPTTDDVAIMRSMIPDDAPVFDGEYMFSNQQLGHFYTVGRGNILRATAYAVSAIAVSEALINKVIKTQDLSTDGAKVATALLAKAELLFKQADDADEETLSAAFEIIDYGWGRSRPELTEGEWRL